MIHQLKTVKKMLNKKYDYIIVGSGIYGATFAYMAKQHGKKCLVIEKRSSIGGNIRCEDIDGITVHLYGPHIFHTSDDEVWQFVNQFVKFNNYINSPIANYNGELYNLPFNMNTFHEIWGNEVKTPEEAIKKINSEKDVKEITNLEEQAISMVGKTIYQKLVKGYTEKQWGRKCTELPPSIIKRLPLRMTYNNNYFNDKYQGIPIEGYNVLIERLLDGIEVNTNCDFLEKKEEFEKLGEKILFTGAIDEYFNYCCGHLEYRAVNFTHEVLNIPNAQGNAVINYTSNNEPYTRITESKHFLALTNDAINATQKTVITKEFSEEYDGTNIPAYPILTENNIKRYAKYKILSSRNKNVIFGGRLGKYKYMDMAPAIREVLDYWKNEK